MKCNELTHSEEIVMKGIWELEGAIRLSHIVEHVNRENGLTWKPQTVSTFISKLVRKGYLEPYRSGQYIYYHILISMDEYRRYLVKKNLSFWNHDNVLAYVSDLCHARQMTREEIRRLKEELDELDTDIN